MPDSSLNENLGSSIVELPPVILDDVTLENIKNILLENNKEVREINISQSSLDSIKTILVDNSENNKTLNSTSADISVSAINELNSSVNTLIFVLVFYVCYTIIKSAFFKAKRGANK